MRELMWLTFGIESDVDTAVFVHTQVFRSPRYSNGRAPPTRLGGGDGSLIQPHRLIDQCPGLFFRDRSIEALQNVGQCDTAGRIGATTYRHWFVFVLAFGIAFIIFAIFQMTWTRWWCFCARWRCYCHWALVFWWIVLRRQWCQLFDILVLGADVIAWQGYGFSHACSICVSNFNGKNTIISFVRWFAL